MEAIDIPAIAVDRSGRIIALNSALAGETGIPPDTLAYVQRHIWDVFYDGLILNQVGSFLSPLVETLVSGREFTYRYHRYDVPGKTESQAGRFSTTFLTRSRDGTTDAAWSFYLPAYMVRNLFIEKIFAVRSVIELIASRDAYTRGHVERVTAYALTIGQIMSLGMPDLIRLFSSAFTHDVGKVFVPERVLNKPGRLTPEEMDAMRTHPEYGARLLSDFCLSPKLISVVRHHHEQFDGTGYPDGLKGENIPLLSRILAVADAFEAMTAERIYRPAMAVRAALAELGKNAGSQFDPRVVEAVLDFAARTDLARCKDPVTCLNQEPCPGCFDFLPVIPRSAVKNPYRRRDLRPNPEQIAVLRA